MAFTVAEVSLFIQGPRMLLFVLSDFPPPLCPQASPLCASLALKHYLLKPVQRIPQYQLLLTGTATEKETKHLFHVRKSESAWLQRAPVARYRLTVAPWCPKEFRKHFGTPRLPSLTGRYNEVFEVQPKSDLVM